MNLSTIRHLIPFENNLQGGIKAVVWTDVIQIMLMYGTLVLIIVKGTADVGGLSVVVERNFASGRLEAPE